MITGDNPKTAEAIARQTNILDKEPEPTHATKPTHDATQDAAHAEALTGRQFESLTEHQQIQLVRQTQREREREWPCVGVGVCVCRLLSRLSSDEHQPADKNATSFGLVFSRTEPRHKQQIVKILKRLGCVVAMTGVATHTPISTYGYLSLPLSLSLYLSLSLCVCVCGRMVSTMPPP